MRTVRCKTSLDGGIERSQDSRLKRFRPSQDNTRGTAASAAIADRRSCESRWPRPTGNARRTLPLKVRRIRCQAPGSLHVVTERGTGHARPNPPTIRPSRFISPSTNRELNHACRSPQASRGGERSHRRRKTAQHGNSTQGSDSSNPPQASRTNSFRENGTRARIVRQLTVVS